MAGGRRTTPGEVVAAIIVLTGTAGAIWAGLNGHVPAGIGRTLGKIVGIPVVLALVGIAVAAGYAVNRMLGVEPEHSVASEQRTQERERRQARHRRDHEK